MVERIEPVVRSSLVERPHLVEPVSPVELADLVERVVRSSLVEPAHLVELVELVDWPAWPTWLSGSCRSCRSPTSYASAMSTEIVCIECGSDEHLFGTRRDDDLIELRCEACGVTFTRDPRPSCPACGGFEMEAMPKVLVEKSRGSQLSIQGVQREFLCRVCDEAEIRRQRDGHLPTRLAGSD